MDYLTADQVKDWASEQADEGYWCESCLTKLAQTSKDEYYCPNEMCLYREQGEIEVEE